MISGLLLTRIDKLLAALRSRRMLNALLRHGVLASGEHRRIFKREFKTIVDIGANKGQFTLAARVWAPQAQVFAFEPLGSATAKFREVFAGDPGVNLYEAAIGPEETEATLHVSGADDSSSLLPISDLQEAIYPGTGEVANETVKVGRLQEFLAIEAICPPALLKIDVQGYELEVLKGCSELFPQFEIILVECSFVELYEGQAFAHEIIRYLGNQDFILSSVYNLEYSRHGQALQGDFVFRQVTNSHPNDK
jgi:FkbM family methyltransferase